MDDAERFVARPYSIIIDTREQSAFGFRDIKADRKEGGGPLVLKTKRKALKTGDYSIEGIDDRVAVERKSLEDLFGCVGSDRDRFERQLDRLNKLETAALVVEADWNRIFKGCERSKLPPKAVFRSVIAWQQDYFPKVHWWMMPGKRSAEIVTFRILDRFWKSHIED